VRGFISGALSKKMGSRSIPYAARTANGFTASPNQPPSFPPRAVLGATEDLGGVVAPRVGVTPPRKLPKLKSGDYSLE